MTLTRVILTMEQSKLSTVKLTEIFNEINICRSLKKIHFKLSYFFETDIVAYAI